MGVLEDMEAARKEAGKPTGYELLSDMDAARAAAVPSKSGGYDGGPVPPPPSRTLEAPKEPFSLRQHLVRQLVGTPEAIASTATGMLAAPIGAAAGLYKGIVGGKYGTAQGAQEAQQRAADVTQSLTYRPRSEAGQERLEQFGRAFDASKLGGLGPPEAMALSNVLSGPAAGARQAARPPVAAQHGMASVGAAGTAPLEQSRALVAGRHPELVAAVEEVAKKNGKVNNAVLQRHVEADSLPIPMRLTKGEATQDVVHLSEEKNARAQNGGEGARIIAAKNKQLADNAQAIREQAAPDVFAQTTPEIGDRIIQGYKKKGDAIDANITANYKALEEANGGSFPLDAKSFKASADAALKKKLLSSFVPKETSQMLKGLGNTMTFEQFENMRTNLAATMRSGADGNVKRAAGVIRQSLEEMPLQPEAQGLKAIADRARASVVEREKLLNGDPAFRSAYEGEASADKFIAKHVIGADLKDVRAMKANLAHDPEAQQAIAAGTMDHLRGNAMRGGSETFSQAGYNRALEKIRPKLDVIFEPEAKANVERLGNVARWVQNEPAGSYVNRSNTAVALMREGAKTAAEKAVNYALPGLSAGTNIRDILRYVGERKELGKTMAPYQGLELKDVKP